MGFLKTFGYRESQASAASGYYSDITSVLAYLHCESSAPRASHSPETHPFSFSASFPRLMSLQLSSLGPSSCRVRAHTTIRPLIDPNGSSGPFSVYPEVPTVPFVGRAASFNLDSSVELWSIPPIKLGTTSRPGKHQVSTVCVLYIYIHRNSKAELSLSDTQRMFPSLSRNTSPRSIFRIMRKSVYQEKERKEDD